MGYINNDWAGCINDNNSIFGYVFTIGTGGDKLECKEARCNVTVHNKSIVHCFVCCSKSSHMLQNLLADLGHKQHSSKLIYCDNKSAIATAQNPVQHGVKFHSVREFETGELIKVLYCPTEEQLVDVLINGLTKKQA